MLISLFLMNETKKTRMMKNTGKNIVMALLAGIFIFSAFSINIVSLSATELPKYETKTGNTAVKSANIGLRFLGDIEGRVVEIAGIPQKIKSAVISKFVAYSIEDAFLGKDGVYRLVLKNESSRRIAYYAEDGEYLKQETVKEGMRLVSLTD